MFLCCCWRVCFAADCCVDVVLLVAVCYCVVSEEDVSKNKRFQAVIRQVRALATEKVCGDFEQRTLYSGRREINLSNSPRCCVPAAKSMLDVC